MEFAILLPILLLIVFGITEFGRALYSYNTLVKATRDAARYVMAQQPGGGADAAAQCLTVHGNTGCSGAPLADGLTTAMVSICDWQRCPGTHQSQGSAPPVNLVTVTITGYKYKSSLIPLVVQNLIPPDEWPFAQISTTMKGNL